jgi:DNA-binding response OmpR family regulator
MNRYGQSSDCWASEKGFDADGYTDPVQALEQFKLHQYEVVLLDIRMPKLDVMKLCKQMRAVDCGVIKRFVSACKQYKRQFEITNPQEQSGCFIQKPFRIDNLLSIIHGRVEDK